jgi:carbamoylphosphate synthase small subunit
VEKRNVSADSYQRTIGEQMKTELGCIEITDDEDIELQRIERDGIRAFVVDMGNDQPVVDAMVEREMDTVIGPPNCPISAFNYYEPMVIVYTDGDVESEWTTPTIKHFFRKVPIVGIGAGKDAISEELDVAMNADGNIPQFGVYTYDSFGDDVSEKIQYLAVHFNMQDNNYWRSDEER